MVKLGGNLVHVVVEWSLTIHIKSLIYKCTALCTAICKNVFLKAHLFFYAHAFSRDICSSLNLNLSNGNLSDLKPTAIFFSSSSQCGWINSWGAFVSLIIPFKFQTKSLLFIHNSLGITFSYKTVLYTIYVLRYRTTVKLCNVFRWETLTLISSCGKTFHVKLSISSLTCWSTNQRRGWVYGKLLLIHGFKYWNSQELKSVNNTKSQQSDWEPTTLDWSKISNIVHHIHIQ